MTKPSEVIKQILDSETISGLGVMHNVAANIADEHGVERALTYLLGCQDAFGAAGIKDKSELIKRCRDQLKAEFRTI